MIGVGHRMWGAYVILVAVARLDAVAARPLPPAMPPAPAFITGNLIFFFLVAAEVAKSLTKLFYYRRGV